MDRFQAMRVFVAVVEAGSFVGAANDLGMSKAATSRHVGELEARLGVRLLHRTTRKLSLTEEGEVFHARCRSLLAEIEEAEAEVSSRTGAARGTLKISAPQSFGLLHLAPLWPEFMARFGDVFRPLHERQRHPVGALVEREVEVAPVLVGERGHRHHRVGDVQSIVRR